MLILSKSSSYLFIYNRINLGLSFHFRIHLVFRNNMRVKRTTYIIILFIITWATVVYFAFTNRPINIIDTNYENDIDVRLLNLEIGISEQSKLNQDMIYKLHRYLDKKKQSKEPLNDNNINNNNDINNVEPMIKRDFDGNVIPVLVFACNRISVSRCLEQLIQHRPNPDQFPIIVSQASKKAIVC